MGRALCPEVFQDPGKVVVEVVVVAVTPELILVAQLLRDAKRIFPGSGGKRGGIDAKERLLACCSPCIRQLAQHFHTPRFSPPAKAAR